MTQAPATRPFARIARISRLARALTAACAVWIVGATLWHWAHPARVAENAHLIWGADFGDFSAAQLAAGFASALLPAGAGLGALYCLWRLFGVFLSGRVFQVEPALWLRRAGFFLIAAAACAVLDNSLEATILSLNLGVGHRLLAIGFPPLFFFGLLAGTIAIAMAEVFIAAAEMAEDHAAIV
ncbi:hypothetical protein M2321_002171 [Rhodoblastus acidophilus]|nr:DUF2975 domain-containing protein [Rhodoblastus acidophilus]MCW2274593.1 hypothetical protein [Rhodoblastus acidophilus]